MEHLSIDLVVIGSGISGLCAAKTYLQLHPSASITIVEAARGLGGVWALDRIYPHLQTNNLNGFFEYSDFPSSVAELDVPKDAHIPGRQMGKYLDAYSKRFDLNQRIRFNTRVESAEYKGSAGWLLTVTSPTSAYTIHAARLIVASGLCSRPNIPSLSHWSSDSFHAPIIHGSQMTAHPDTFTKSKSVTVFGGTKMAWDAAYAYATAGVHVDWVLRESGHGPCWMAPAKVTPLQLKVENLVMTRFMTWFSPCVWNSNSFTLERWARRLLHGTRIGQKMVQMLFGAIQADICATNRYDRCAETAKLKPWTDLFNVAGGQGVLDDGRDVMGMVESGQISVHIDELFGFSDHTITLKERGDLHSDALVCCTGWKFEPSVKFLPEGIERELGLPYFDSIREENNTLNNVDAEIDDAFPILRKQGIPPSKNGSKEGVINRGYKLYRFMAPQPPYFHNRTIAFIGMQINFGVPLTVQAQSLWIAAYFHNQLPHLKPQASAIEESQLMEAQKNSVVVTEKAVDDESPAAANTTATLDQHIRASTLLHTRFIRRRFTWGFGERFPDFMFELMPYLDMLLGDLGLEAKRKMASETGQRHVRWSDRLTLGIWGRVKGALRETFEPYGKTDYRGLVDEWVETRRR